MTEGPIRVAVVDDSALMRRMITAALSGAPDLVVVGAAGSAQEARGLIRSSDPDVVTLDVAMPGMSGLDFLRRIMELRPTPVIMVSSLTAAGAETSVRALQIGAIDVVEKPQGPDLMDAFAAALQAKVRLAASARSTLASRRIGGSGPARPPAPPQATYARGLIAIGASTGGVSALTRLLAGLPPGLPPIAIIQHMPAGYPERFAARLRAELGRDVAEARPGEALGPGAIRFAPGDRHLRIARRGGALRVQVEEGPPVSGHRPSVDVLFESVARALGGHAIGVILTGMGRDGATGLAAMRRAGAACLAQDRASSVVWGMPRAAVELGAADEEVALDALPARICHHAMLEPANARPDAVPGARGALKERSADLPRVNLRSRE